MRPREHWITSRTRCTTNPDEATARHNRRSALAGESRIGHYALVPGRLDDAPQLVVVGEGVSLARPDSCIIGVALNAMRDTIAEALRDVAALADRAMIALRDSGFEDVDLPTRNMSVRDWIDPTTRQVTARVGEYQFAIVVHELGAVSAAVSTLADTMGDALQIQGIAFAHSDPAPFLAAARRAAVQDARARAEDLAAAAGVRLGGIQLVQEGVTTGWVGRAVAARAAQELLAPMNPGSQAITARVTVVFALDRDD